MSQTARNALRTGGVLFAFALVGTAMMAWTHKQTSPIIERSQQAEKLALINQVLPQHLYDNDLLSDRHSLPADNLLGTRKASGMWLARKNQQPVGIVLEAIAREGYGGDIALLIGIAADGTVTGVRVTQHRETPGLGDYIDIAKSPWILQFDGKLLTGQSETLWRVKKDDGQFDARAGATITSRAIVKAVRDALKYFQLHRDELLRATETSPT